MNDNKAFAAYAVLVVGGAGALMLTLMLTGIATVPPLTTFLTDVTMGLCIRAAYKQVGGWDWNEWKWSFAGDSPESMAAVLPTRVAAESLSEAA